MAELKISSVLKQYGVKEEESNWIFFEFSFKLFDLEII